MSPVNKEAVADSINVLKGYTPQEVQTILFWGDNALRNAVRRNILKTEPSGKAGEYHINGQSLKKYILEKWRPGKTNHFRLGAAESRDGLEPVLAKMLSFMRSNNIESIFVMDDGEVEVTKHKKSADIKIKFR